MVVVSDTSVISNLFQIDHLWLLPTLFGQIMIPPAVAQELGRMSGSRRFALADFSWLKARTLENHLVASGLKAYLDPGESEAIALAEQLKADALLIDEVKGRKMAQDRSIPITGLLGVLLAAKSMRHIVLVTPLMDSLILDANFRIEPGLYAMVKKEADE